MLQPTILCIRCCGTPTTPSCTMRMSRRTSTTSLPLASLAIVTSSDTRSRTGASLRLANEAEEDVDEAAEFERVLRSDAVVDVVVGPVSKGQHDPAADAV